MPPPYSQPTHAPATNPIPITAHPVAALGPDGRPLIFDLKPHHAMWALAGFSALAALVSGLGWILAVGGCAYSAWYLQTRGTQWPPDIADALARYRLAPQATGRPRIAGSGPGQPAPVPYMPFRSLTFTEMFRSAWAVLSRNWPTLVGVPAVILTAFAVIFAVVLTVVMTIMIQSMDAMVSSSASIGSIGTSMMVMFVVLTLLTYAVALPADALLIALSVIVTHKAVSGEQIRLSTVLPLARQRMFAVVRLTLAFYTIFFVTDAFFYFAIFTTLLTAPFAAFPVMILLFAFNFAVGIMLSLSPIVVVMEGRGVMDSFRRSFELVKLDWTRILGIHAMWAICVVPILLLPTFLISIALGVVGVAVFFIVALSVLIAYTRTLQMVAYMDLRMRYENFDRELLDAWTRNTRV
ncbi:putative transmembrane protein [Mycobacteroides abscessus subsp. abscessus]|nr:putative transmembrane protein [Mycobacteroides abscessus subsp. abscessus]